MPTLLAGDQADRDPLDTVGKAGIRAVGLPESSAALQAAKNWDRPGVYRAACCSPFMVFRQTGLRKNMAFTVAELDKR